MKTKKKLFALSTSLTALFLPLIASAAAPSITQVTTGGGIFNLDNALDRIITWILGFVGFLAVLFIIWGGILYLTAAGNADQAKKGRQTLTYAIIGLIIVILSFLIVAFTENLVNYIFTGNQ